MGLDVRVREDEENYIISEHLGSYSGFHFWRKAVAKAAGFDLDNMEGFGGKQESWDGKPFPLILNHSDCDGGYSLEQILEVLREAEAIKKLNVDDYEQSDKFIRLCKVALEHKKPIEFG